MGIVVDDYQEDELSTICRIAERRLSHYLSFFFSFILGRFDYFRIS